MNNSQLKVTKPFTKNAVIMASLFIVTVLVGMVDAYFVAPELQTTLSEIYLMKNVLLLGVFSVLVLAVGVVGISIAFFPVIKRQSETIALVYLSFRIVECLLLAIGPIIYLLLINIGSANIDNPFLDVATSQALPTILLDIKYQTYQLAMLVLGFGNFFLCYSLFKSRVIPRFLSVWGFAGYVLLFLSALLDMLGIVDTINGKGALMYVPGGLWEFIVLPAWLFVKGFQVTKKEV